MTLVGGYDLIYSTYKMGGGGVTPICISIKKKKREEIQGPMSMVVGKFELGNPQPLVTTLNYLCLSHGDQRLFSIRNYHKSLSWLFLIYLNAYVMVYSH